MAGGQHHVFHASSLDGFGPGAGVKLFSGEFIRQFAIFIHIDGLGLHGPLATSHLSIKSPMDKHTKTQIFPVFDVFFHKRYSFDISIYLSIAYRPPNSKHEKTA